MKGPLFNPSHWISIGVFSFCVALLWIGQAEQMNSMIAWIGGAYALLCFGFLIFQMVAFVKAHTKYDQEIEEVKYEVHELENEEL
jgi:1,4-dihydroxy-2-naphthoate octaprenyltransferase